MLLRSRIGVALAAFVFTGIFFAEYIPPLRTVHIPFDLDGYHYPLADYAFQSLKQGRFPQWDPSIYSGMSFVANVQAALFYPPTWLMFAAGWSRDVLSYQALEDLTLAHVWLAFTLCFFWLRARKLDSLACALGAGVFAYSGYLCLQLQHFGLVAGYAWFPLGLWGIDEAAARQSWKPLWKATLAAAMCFLAGYPPTWLVFAVVMGTYALAGPWRWRAAMGAALALAASLALAAIQLLPTWEASQFREPEQRYGGGFKDPAFYLSHFVPNYFDYGPDRPVHTNPQKEYLYLGAPALAGIALLARRRPRAAIPGVAVGAACLVMVMNPFGLVWAVIQHSILLGDLARSFYFLAGITLSAAYLAALGVDDFLRAPAGPVPRWWVRAALAAMGAWAIAEAIRWPAGFAAGWAAAVDPLLMLAVFCFSIYVYRAQRGELRAWVGLALLVSVGVDYKVFGTSKRFNSSPGDGPRFSLSEYPAMDTGAYREMRQHADYRVALGEYAPRPGEIRHTGLRTPQGFDPFLSVQYRQLIARFGPQLDDRQFLLDPANDEALQLFGVRYWITSAQAQRYAEIKADPRFRWIDGQDVYYKVFEYVNARPPYGLEGSGEVELLAWEAERRAFRVRAEEAGLFTLSEQFFPGWRVTVDSAEVPLERWNTAFQAVPVAAGEHTVEFRFRSRLLLLGAGISLAALGGLIVWARAARQVHRAYS